MREIQVWIAFLHTTVNNNQKHNDDSFMREYCFYQENKKIFLSSKNDDQPIHFKWIDCVYEDLNEGFYQDHERWLQDFYQTTGILINEFHMRDILNLDHPCAFDVMEDYDLLIFKKLISPEDEILRTEQPSDRHKIFGLATTPVSFILTSTVLITIREKGNQAVESYIARLDNVLKRETEDQNKPRRLPQNPLDLSMRLLNVMIDGYLALRLPLTHRVEFWQQELLQGRRRFTKWHQLLQENMAFQQIENLCEEQIETLKELRDEVVDSYPHLSGKRSHDSKDLTLVRLDDLTSHVERIQKHTTRLGRAIQSAIDLHFSAIANQTNENMRILAIITAIFAPLTLLTGVYGMNFEYIPGLKSPQGFWVMLVIMLMSSIFLLYYFYRQHLVGRGEKSVIDMLAQQQHNRYVNMFWFMDYEPIKQSIKEVNKIKNLTKWFVFRNK